MAACSAVESETTISGFKFIKKPRMRVMAPTIFSFSISPDFYHYMDVDHDDDDDDDDDDYISDGNDDYSGSDVNMIGVVDSDRDDHQVSTATPHLHVPELLPQQFDDHDDEEFYSAQTDLISSPSISTGSYSSDPTYTSPSSSSSSSPSPGYTPSVPDHYTPSQAYAPS